VGSGGFGLTVAASGKLTSPISNLVSIADEVFSQNRLVDKKLLVSMELFAAARMEATPRARFVSLVSAVEPLLKQDRINSPTLEEAIRNTQSLIGQADDLDEVTKDSLNSRLGELRRESISQSLRRLVAMHFPNSCHAATIARQAYDTRSKILHDGDTITDLDEIAAEFEDLLRKIYSNQLNLKLKVPIREF
jgi:Apea-like HEPN